MKAYELLSVDGVFKVTEREGGLAPIVVADFVNESEARRFIAEKNSDAKKCPINSPQDAIGTLRRGFPAAGSDKGHSPEKRGHIARCKAHGGGYMPSPQRLTDAF